MRPFRLLRASAMVVAAVSVFVILPQSTQAQGTCVAAIVNDLSITSLEVQQRAKFAMMVSRTADTAGTRDRASRQLLNIMIDERLQLAEAKRNGVSVAKHEIDERIQQIEQSNNIPTGGLEQGLRNAGIPIRLLRDQIEANIAWSKLLLRRARGSISVTDGEIDEEMRRMRGAAGKPDGRTGEPRLNMLQLLLPLPSNATAEEVERQKGVAQSIISQSKTCTELRRTCGRTKGCTSADSDGVAPSALPPAMADAARGAAIGQALGPYHAGTNMQIVAVCSRSSDGGPSRESVERRLQTAKLESAAQRYMREIRRNAVIDIRSNCKI